MSSTDEKREPKYSKPIIRPNSRRKNFLIEKDVDEGMATGARAFSGGNQTELIHKIFRGEVTTEELLRAIG